MAQYSRVYKDDAEKARRFEVFKANVKFIESFNAAGNRKFRLGVNQFADLTNDEFRATKTNKGFNPNVAKVPTRFRYANVSTDALPASVDWRTKGAVTPIKDQGQCGKLVHLCNHKPMFVTMSSQITTPAIKNNYWTQIIGCRMLLGVLGCGCHGGHCQDKHWQAHLTFRARVGGL
jgi:hypothetical protein